MPTLAPADNHRIPQKVYPQTYDYIGHVPSTVELIKNVSAWNNSETMSSILSKLDATLRHIGAEQTILLMDSAKCHISPKVLEHAASLTVWVRVAPTDTTWLSQLLDVTVFCHYKRFLRNEFRKCLIEQSGVTAWERHRMITCAATGFLQSNSWAGAFRSLGLLGDRGNISVNLQSHGPEIAIIDPSGAHTPKELKRVLPQRLSTPHLYNHLMAQPRRKCLIIR